MVVRTMVVVANNRRAYIFNFGSSNLYRQLHRIRSTCVIMCTRTHGMMVCLSVRLFIPFGTHKFSFSWQLIASKIVYVFDFLVNSC